MGIVQYLQVMLFVFNLTLSSVAKKAVNCQNFKFAIDEDVVHNHILKGHVFQRLTVPDYPYYRCSILLITPRI